MREPCIFCCFLGCTFTGSWAGGSSGAEAGPESSTGTETSTQMQDMGIPRGISAIVPSVCSGSFFQYYYVQVLSSPAPKPGSWWVSSMAKSPGACSDGTCQGEPLFPCIAVIMMILVKVGLMWQQNAKEFINPYFKAFFQGPCTAQEKRKIHPFPGDIASVSPVNHSPPAT